MDGGQGGGRDGNTHTHVHGDPEKCIIAVKETETERGVRGRQRRKNELAERDREERESRGEQHGLAAAGRKDGQKEVQGRRKEREGTPGRPTQRKERQEKQKRTARNQRWRQIRGGRPLGAREGGGQRDGPCGHFWGCRCFPGGPFWAPCRTGGVGSLRTGDGQARDIPWWGMATLRQWRVVFPGTVYPMQ